MQTVTPSELKQELDSGKDVFILDVREPHEYEICCLEGATLIPLGQVPARIEELNREHDIVVMCRSGARSGKATQYLAQKGFPKVRNLTGGILAWSDEVDPSVPKY